jgi:hypothetical protein
MVLDGPWRHWEALPTAQGLASRSSCWPFCTSTVTHASADVPAGTGSAEAGGLWMVNEPPPSPPPPTVHPPLRSASEQPQLWHGAWMPGQLRHVPGCATDSTMLRLVVAFVTTRHCCDGAAAAATAALAPLLPVPLLPVPLLPVPPLLPPLLLLGLLVLHGCSSRLRPNNGGTPAELLAAATSRRSAGDSAAAILGRLRRRLGFANDRRKSKGAKIVILVIA